MSSEQVVFDLSWHAPSNISFRGEETVRWQVTKEEWDEMTTVEKDRLMDEVVTDTLFGLVEIEIRPRTESDDAS